MVMGDPELGAMSHTRLEITGFPGVRGTQVILKLGFSDRIPRNCWEIQMLRQVLRMETQILIVIF